MAGDLRGKSLPLDPTEYPPYEFREYPKMLGYEPEGTSNKSNPPGNMVIAQNKDHEEELRAQYPFLPEPGSTTSPTPPAPSDVFAENKQLRERLAELEGANGLQSTSPTDESGDPWSAEEPAPIKSKGKKK